MGIDASSLTLQSFEPPIMQAGDRRLVSREVHDTAKQTNALQPIVAMASHLIAMASKPISWSHVLAFYILLPLSDDPLSFQVIEKSDDSQAIMVDQWHETTVCILLVLRNRDSRTWNPAHLPENMNRGIERHGQKVTEWSGLEVHLTQRVAFPARSWRPSLVGWRPSLFGWRPSLASRFLLLVGWNSSS